MESPDISVVVLAYRSASTIEGFVASLVTSLEEEKIDWEIILVGNYFEGAGDLRRRKWFRGFQTGIRA